jgi:hypothetical protein
MNACLLRWVCALRLTWCTPGFAVEPSGPVSLVFAGDIVLDDAAGEMIRRGECPFADMLGLIKQSGLMQFGGGLNLAEAHAPRIIERKGLRIALLGYSKFMPRSFEADYDAPGMAWSEDEQVVADIQKARSALHADIVIPVMHWGWENELTANTRQRQLARTMIDAGAATVTCGRPSTGTRPE